MTTKPQLSMGRTERGEERPTGKVFHFYALVTINLTFSFLPAMIVVCQFTTVQRDTAITVMATKQQAHLGTSRRGRRRTSTEVYLYMCTNSSTCSFKILHLAAWRVDKKHSHVGDNCGVSASHKSEGHMHKSHGHRAASSSGHREGERRESRYLLFM